MFVPENGQSWQRVSFSMRRVRLFSRAQDFHYSIKKRYGKLGRYVSLIHVLYRYYYEMLANLFSNQSVQIFCQIEIFREISKILSERY